MSLLAWAWIRVSASLEKDEATVRAAMSYLVIVARYWVTCSGVGCSGFISATSCAPGIAAIAFIVSSKVGMWYG